MSEVVVLERADIALFSDVEDTRLILRRVQAYTRDREYEQATVGPFAGDQQPTVFRGEGRPRSYSMSVRFLAAEHANYAALISLFEAAHDDADGRLLFRSHLGQAAGLNPVEAISVSRVTETAGPAGAVDVTWTAQTVAYSLEV